jgi:hypothetical protein
MQLFADSMKCSEYTETFTYYLLDPDDKLLAVHRMYIDWTSEGTVTETSLNFRDGSPQLLTREGKKERRDTNYIFQGGLQNAENLESISEKPEEWKEELKRRKKGEI